MAATSMNREGKVMLMSARDMVTLPSSSGWRSTSRTFFLNSGSSSRNSTPLCARLTSPGFGIVPPPMSPASEIVWWGARKGRTATRGLPSILPATECIFVVSMASSKLISGRIVTMRWASMVLPEPGGPTMMRLWPPAEATSRARLAWLCPRTSIKSTS